MRYLARLLYLLQLLLELDLGFLLDAFHHFGWEINWEAEFERCPT